MVPASAVHMVIVVLAYLALLGIGGWLIVIDGRTHRLPNRIVLPTLGGALVLVIIDALVMGEVWPLTRAVGGMLVLCGFYIVMRFVSRGGIGGGDVKLAAVIGLVLGWHGWQALAVGAASAFVLGALYALALMALRRANGATRIAFGPWMIIGAILGVVVA
ncbi:peptidase A24 [Microbacterium sp. CH12i]|uniref:prepilin peptidase n=1 Tax=Microbacterium sp. CH12i TaxID=1479651 RepID=UPI0004616C0C|nr:A24 family peptidase [Microbacterium sp. CH12i]KDA06357.1 peptidase A24 [Microbacterium sp. CH12i]